VSWVRSLEPIEKPSKMLQELVGQQRVGRDFAHHDQLQVVLALLQAVFGQQVDHGLAFADGTDERHHQLHVGQAHFFADLLHGAAFHLEAVAEGLRDVARGATEAEHRVFFFRLVQFAAEQLAVLVGLEVGEADDDRVRPEGGGDGGHAFDQLLDEEFLRRGVAAGAALDFLALRSRQAIDVEDGLRVDADHVVDDELDAGQTDAGVRQLGEIEGQFRVADVHHDLERNIRHGRDVAGGDLRNRGDRDRRGRYRLRCSSP
jgi:hypothetical protein